MNKTVALIPLRGGSKSIKKKNIKLIAGKPLCEWVLNAAIKAKVFDEIYVSTDDDEIASVVKAINSEVIIIKRPAELATDSSSTESVMFHFAEIVDFDILATIQATSPLIKADDFINALEKFEAEKLDTLLTGVRVKRFFWTLAGVPLNYDPSSRPFRQQFKGSVMENGAFYLTRKKILEEHRSRLGGKIGIFEMPASTAVELDEPDDWELVEKLILKESDNAVYDRLGAINLLALDCDGVLTDAGMYYSESGEELKKFSTRDGQGLALIQNIGVKIVIITGESSQIVRKRAEKIKTDELYMGIDNKGKVIQKLLNKYKLNIRNIAYIGDDINDLSAIENSGFSFAVNDAMDELRSRVDYVLKCNGGMGAVREVCNLILEAKQQLMK